MPRPSPESRPIDPAILSVVLGVASVAAWGAADFDGGLTGPRPHGGGNGATVAEARSGPPEEAPEHMATELPEGMAVESIWVIEATYAPDAAETRPAHRAEHLARIAALRDAGVIIEAGAFADLSTSLLLVRADAEGSARELVASDVYMRAGVWVEVRIRRFGRVCRVEEVGGR